MPNTLLHNRLLSVAAAAIALMACGVFGVACANASVGILPPANPAADCDAQGAAVDFNLQGLNACRAKEHVGPLVLPSNWSALSGSEQLFVLVDLERVNRGLAPVVGLSPALDQIASQAADAGTDPSFPNGGFVGGGGIWFGGDSAIAADYAWMYDDGPNGLDINVDCPRSGSSDCWLHRDIVLWKGTGGALVAGGGSAGNSYAFEVLSGYSTAGLRFTWAHELHYFAQKPGVEPLNPLAHPAKSSPVKGHKHHRPGSGSSGGGSGSSGGGPGITITVG